MLIKTHHFIFIMSLMMGTIMACSSSSWLMAWIGLELNLMSFTPILINKLKSSSLEMAIKYFLIQAMASMIIILLSIYLNSNSPNNLMYEMNMLLTLALSMKAGVAPLHFWFPQIMEYAQWFQAILILTWQKIAPLILLTFSFNMMIYITIISSALTGMFGGMNQMSLKKILTYSSIMHSAWLISISFISDSLWWNYFFIYSIITISVVAPLALMNIFYINMINYIKMNIINKMLIFLNILSLAGLPPFMGFFIKLISINMMIFYKINIIVIITLIFSSLVAFYFYSRLMYSTFLNYENKNKLIYLPSYVKSTMSKMIIFSFLGNLFISFMVLLY